MFGVHKYVNETRLYHKRKHKAEQAILKKYGNTLLYHRCFYQSDIEPMKFCCKTHGFFWATVKDMLKTDGCPACRNKQQQFYHKGKKYTTEIFLRTVKQANPQYSIFLPKHKGFKGFGTPVLVYCPIHGPLKYKNPRVLLTPTACWKCRAGKNRLTTEKYIAKAIKKHGNYYNYDKTVYVSARQSVTIACPIHGDFQIQASYHTNGGNGCSKCKHNGFDSKKPGIVYYLKVANGLAYKIGITNYNITQRYTKKDQTLFEVIAIWEYANGKDARKHETALLQEFKHLKYKGPPLLSGCGIAEMFKEDILQYL